MIVASCVARLHLPESRSLKDKRQIVQGLLRKLRERHNLSAIELEDRDARRRAVLALALVARDHADAEARAERARRDIELWSGLKYVDFETAYL